MATVQIRQWKHPKLRLNAYRTQVKGQLNALSNRHLLNFFVKAGIEAPAHRKDRIRAIVDIQMVAIYEQINKATDVLLDAHKEEIESLADIDKQARKDRLALQAFNEVMSQASKHRITAQ